ncbi:MAG: hypothetical protein ACI9VM_000071 [Candidatus Azotimanducaceae bacterium]|jgi:hypothetical protein
MILFNYMEKLTEKQFFLIVNGPSRGGKSTTVQNLMEQYSGMFNAHSDTIKWLISDYDADTQRGIAHALTKSLMKTALEQGLSVLKEGALFEPEKIIAIPESLNVPVFIANISAPLTILEERFNASIESRKDGTQPVKTTHDRLIKLHSMYLDTKMETPLEFDSSTQTTEEISKSIVGHIQKNI